MRDRFKELDGLRGIAALFVVFSHFTGGYDSKYVASEPFRFDMYWGAYGVQLFFLISGFVILMSGCTSRRPSDFVISRAARLYPAYWLALCESIVLSVAFAVPHTDIGWVNRILNFAMVQRLFLVPNVDEVYWTLAIEMQFYILVFVILWITRCRLTDKLLYWISGIWLLVAFCIALVFGGYSRGLDPQLVWVPVKMLLNVFVVQWAPFFITGMFAFRARYSSCPDAGKFWALSCLGGAFAVLMHATLHGWTESVWVLGVVLIFLAVVARRKTRVLLLGPVQWFGTISYSLYIGHVILGNLVIHWTVDSVGRPLAMCIAFVVVGLNAAVLHYTAETRGSRQTKELLLCLRARIDRRFGIREVGPQ